MFGGPDAISLLVALMMLFGGGPGGNNDLLDMVPTETYWQVKNVTVSVEQLERDAAPDKAPENVEGLLKALGSEDFKTRSEAKAKLEAMGPAIAPQVKPATESKDPEVAGAATELMKTFMEGGRAREIRRLMAIRTLGERKEKAALPLLKELTASKELFVADYAARAIGQIDGKAVAHVGHQKELLGDLQLLPKDTGIVAEAVGMGGAGLSLERLIDQALDAQGGAMPPMGMPGGKAPDKKKVMVRMTKLMLKGLEAVGNIRVDGVMVGVAKDVGPNGGWVVVSLRGKYDAAAVMAVLKNEAPEGRVKSSREGTVDILSIGGDATLLIPSNDQLVFVAGSGGEKQEGVVKDVAAVLNGGKGVFGENAEMAALLKTVDTSSPVWGVAQVNKDMQAEKIMEGFDTITLVAKMEKDAARFVFTGQGSDAEKVKSSAGAMTDGIQAAIGQVKPMVQQMKAMQAVVDLLESLKVTPTDKTATMTGEMKANFLESALITAGGFFLMGAMDEPEGQAPAVEVAPAPVPPEVPAPTRTPTTHPTR